MKTAIKTDPSQTTSGAQATEDADLLAANGRAAVREVEIEIARILAECLDYSMDDLSEPYTGTFRSGSRSPAPNPYKKELDPEGTPQFGLVAEQVEKEHPDLVARDEDGKASSVRYEAFKSMLLNEFLKQHQLVQEHQGTIGEVKSTAARQEATIAKQEAMITQQQRQIESLTADLQKVSDKLELAKSAPQLLAA
jgi:uncharacterized coiled-coil protein SlyX